MKNAPDSPDIHLINTRHKYSDLSGPESLCMGFQLAICTSILGGIGCSLTYIIGEIILESKHVHKAYPRHAHSVSINDVARMGAIGGLITNLTLYAAIVIFACNCDPARKKPVSEHNKNGMQLVCGENNDRHPILVILTLLSMHISNMLVSGLIGYWIYTRNHKSVVDFQDSMESLAVGIAVTTIPFCIFNLALTTAYGTFQPAKHVPGPQYHAVNTGCVLPREPVSRSYYYPQYGF